MSRSCHIILASVSPPPHIFSIFTWVLPCRCFLIFVIISCCCPSCFAPAPPPSQSRFVSFPCPPPTSQRSLQFIIRKETCEGGGWGWGERAREHERQGREGCWGVTEEGKWLCACVSGNSTPWQIQCRCHWSRLRRRRAYFFSPLETHTCTAWKF